VFDADDESSEVSPKPLAVTTFVIDGFRRRDAYKRYKEELDALYALGEPQSEKTAKL